jgi:hypothetical protein
MKTQDVFFDRNTKILVYNENEATVREAKRTASKIFNLYGKLTRYKPIDEFKYVTKNGTYHFHRRNIIYPNGIVKLGKWA